ncbi:7efa5ca3-d651-4f26-9677-b7fff39d0169 [Thermothielavioides terrestris]|uniref:Arsenite methyltransferase n=1 Tax=Thermothielavioides terrestris TaxID=2587410 RepID=A0A3S4F6T2_9PEZI|nr:7efa5ca3-d651-4f26-9677-b7fff39d0169 [Thermothielavioides terrestris]
MEPTKTSDQAREQDSSASRRTNIIRNSEAVAKAFGYSADEFANIPCVAFYHRKLGNPGETLIDLGTGLGFDVFRAATKVGPSGRAIGVDKDKVEPLYRTKSQRAKFAQLMAPGNITFIQANMISVPLPSGTADCVMVNAALNMVPKRDRLTIFREMYRLLKPGGRAALFDAFARERVPMKLAKRAEHDSTIAKMHGVGEIEALLKEAGFAEVLIVDTKDGKFGDYDESEPESETDYTIFAIKN